MMASCGESLHCPLLFENIFSRLPVTSSCVARSRRNRYRRNQAKVKVQVFAYSLLLFLRVYFQTRSCETKQCVIVITQRNSFALETLNFVSISFRPKKNCVTQRSIVKKVQRWLISISLKSSTSSLMCLWARHHASTEAPILSDSMLRLLGLTMLLVSCSFFWQVSMRYGNFQEGKMTSLESMSRVVVLWLLGMTIDCYDGLLQCGKGFEIVFHVCPKWVVQRSVCINIQIVRIGITRPECRISYLVWGRHSKCFWNTQKSSILAWVFDLIDLCIQNSSTPILDVWNESNSRLPDG
jgi:hypothetical protein